MKNQPRKSKSELELDRRLKKILVYPENRQDYIQARESVTAKVGPSANLSKKLKQTIPKRCGLCGKTKHLTRTECCGQWICNDTDQYVIFSFENNSCYRNHSRYTLCASHHEEGHSGRWQDCKKCRNDVETEMYVWYGTNEYNFEKLENPPNFKPTLCAKCNKIIHLGQDGYSMRGKEYFCMKCGDFASILK